MATGENRVGFYCLDVGQASCSAFLYGRPVRAILVDAGGPANEILYFLNHFQISRIPAIIVTHNHQDHNSAVVNIVGQYENRVGTIYFLQDKDIKDPFYSALRFLKKKYRVHLKRLETEDVSEGRKLNIEKCPFDVFCCYPDFASNLTAQSIPNPNLTSAVLLVSVRGVRGLKKVPRVRVLFCGDLDIAGWQYLLARGPTISADILLAPHHGGPQGDPSLHSSIIERVFPDGHGYVLMSFGMDNNYGLPNPSFVQACVERGAVVLCTEKSRYCWETPESVNVQPIFTTIDFLPDRSGVNCAGTIVAYLHDGCLEIPGISAFQSQLPDTCLCRKKGA